MQPVVQQYSDGNTYLFSFESSKILIRRCTHTTTASTGVGAKEPTMVKSPFPSHFPMRDGILTQPMYGNTPVFGQRTLRDLKTATGGVQQGLGQLPAGAPQPCQPAGNGYGCWWWGGGQTGWVYFDSRAPGWVWLNRLQQWMNSQQLQQLTQQGGAGGGQWNVGGGQSVQQVSCSNWSAYLGTEARKHQIAQEHGAVCVGAANDSSDPNSPNYCDPTVLSIWSGEWSSDLSNTGAQALTQNGVNQIAMTLSDGNTYLFTQGTQSILIQICLDNPVGLHGHYGDILLSPMAGGSQVFGFARGLGQAPSALSSSDPSVTSCITWSKQTDASTAGAIVSALDLGSVPPGIYFYPYQGSVVKYVNNVDGSLGNQDPDTPSGNTSIYLCTAQQQPPAPPPVAAPASTGTSPWLIVGIGAAAIALGGIAAYFVTRKPKSAQQIAHEEARQFFLDPEAKQFFLDQQGRQAGQFFLDR